ncbi:hypothetical protein S40288_02545 [Stachybotrys chartarum IBT 40288]|nr:hypothetical protein S40288_02545 [Stachybotrys chartarum IBT 40288]
MANNPTIDSEIEAAAEYGRCEDCFRNYQDAPFRLQDHRDRLLLLGMHRQLDHDGLVYQDGLLPCHLPDARPQFDLLDQYLDSKSPNIHTLLAGLLGNEPLPSHSSLPMGLKIPMQDHDLSLGMDTQGREKAIASKENIGILPFWLPLSPVASEKDEGLAFPPVADKLRLLMLRELDLSDDLPEPYIPERKAAFIDLTSEPSSPINKAVEALCKNAEGGHLESGPSNPSLSSSSFEELQQLGLKSKVPPQLSIEVPLVLDSETAQDGETLTNLVTLDPVTSDETYAIIKEMDSRFSDQFSNVIKQSHSKTMLDVEQENLNPSDAFSRVPVPIQDFHIEAPAWCEQLQNSRTHLSWLQTHIKTFHDASLRTCASGVDAAVKWTPIAPGRHCVDANEESPDNGLAGVDLLSFNAAPSLGSNSYITRRQEISALRLPEDEEVEGYDVPDEDVLEVAFANGCSRDFVGGRQTSTRTPVTEKWLKSKRPFPTSTSPMPARILPASHDGSATSKFLSGFMEVRAVKKARKDSPSKAKPSKPSRRDLERSASDLIPSAQPAHSWGEAMVSSLQTVPVRPQTREQGRCIVSVDLKRTLLKEIEKGWPRELLIDRTFPQCSGLLANPGAASNMALCAEADIAVSASVGIVIATVLQIKQRSLPGSDALPPVRKRIRCVSRKYDLLVVLVTENNAQGEVVNSSTTAQIETYSDFVLFTASLGSTVAPYFIPGGEKTLAQWILATMSRYSPFPDRLQRAALSYETTWEMFLRRLGMNVVAAEKLSATLHEESRNEGLSCFIGKSDQERLEGYRQLLGGVASLSNACATLGRRWP